MTDPDARSLKLGAIAGIASLILMLIANSILPPWPAASTSTEEIASYFSSHHAAFLVQAWLFTAALMLLIVWSGSWHGDLSKRQQPSAAIGVLSGSILFVAAFAGFFVPWIVIASVQDLPASTVRALYEVGLYGQFPGVGMPLALLFGSLGVGAHSTRSLPTLLIALMAVAVPINLMLAGCTAYDGFFVPTGPIGSASSLTAGAIIALTSVAVLRLPPSPGPQN